MTRGGLRHDVTLAKEEGPPLGGPITLTSAQCSSYVIDVSTKKERPTKLASSPSPIPTSLRQPPHSLRSALATASRTRSVGPLPPNHHPTTRSF